MDQSRDVPVRDLNVTFRHRYFDAEDVIVRGALLQRDGYKPAREALDLARLWSRRRRRRGGLGRRRGPRGCGRRPGVRRRRADCADHVRLLDAPRQVDAARGRDGFQGLDAHAGQVVVVAIQIDDIMSAFRALARRGRPLGLGLRARELEPITVAVGRGLGLRRRGRGFSRLCGRRGLRRRPQNFGLQGGERRGKRGEVKAHRLGERANVAVEGSGSLDANLF